MYEYMITWAAEGFRLDLYDTSERMYADTQHQKLAYVFSHNGEVIFRSADYGCSPYVSVDGVDSVMGLLGFLSLQCGDTDAEYFDSYTPRQREWRDEYAEALSCYAYDDSDEECRAEVMRGMRYDESEPTYGETTEVQ